MNLYKCPECGCINSSGLWDFQTRTHYSENEALVLLDENGFGSTFFCPNCDEESDWSDIKLITDESILKNYDKFLKIKTLIDKYSEKHELAIECGGEYIYQSDSAQEDAIELVADIFESLME